MNNKWQSGRAGRREKEQERNSNSIRSRQYRIHSAHLELKNGKGNTIVCTMYCAVCMF